MKDNRSSITILSSKGATKKLVAGGLLSVLGFTVYFAIVVCGYTMNVLCTALEGRRSKLPNWEKFGSLFSEGLQPVLIGLAYTSPIIALLIAELNLQTAELFATYYLWPFYLLLILVISLFLPLAFIRSVVNASLRSAFEFKKIVVFIKENMKVYLTAWIKSIFVYLVAIGVTLGFVIVTAKFYFVVGLTGFLVGTAVTIVVSSFLVFSSTIVVVYFFAKGYRSSKPFDDDQNGNFRASIAIPPPLIK